MDDRPGRMPPSDAPQSRDRLTMLRASWGLCPLPSRLNTIVEAEQARSARIAAWLSLFVPTFLAALYALSPKAIDAMGSFSPVPVILAIFIVIGVLRVRSSGRNAPPDWWVVGSAIVDFALLYGMIWAIHLQYLQPAAFSLKVPTFLYAFVLIAIRGMWFEPRHVLITGAVAALGWVAMTGLALREDPSARTREFVEYLNGNGILLGAEIDKVLAILMFTVILALIIVRGRQQLVMAAYGEAARSNLSQYFAAGVADRIADRVEGSRVGEVEKREGAVLVADIRGFTGLAAEWPAESTLSVLASFHRRLGAVVARHGGAIDKFLGDGALVTFGCITPREDAARVALEAGIDLVRDMENWRLKREREGRRPVLVGVAVSSGLLLVATIGSGDRLEFTVLGDAANRATKLEKYNKVLGSALITDLATFERAQAQGLSWPLAETIPMAEVVGIAGPVPLVRLDQMQRPPSTSSTTPVTIEDSSEAR